ncbi:MAG: prepilin-type N-terminal cleavage/methylation domain-containing protein [Bacteroidia bacterium]|nr:prepilin-type N-terminal cleavage/methylation domain-containing protein [Bacteroidia bacterium]
MLKRYYNRVIIFGRGNSMRKIDKGFSLVELLIVVIIIGILAGILYLVVGPSDDMVREKACGGNRATIMLALDGYRFSNGLNKENYTLENFINDGYKGTLSTENAKCPSGGIYSAGEENGREIVVCSVHSGGDDPGGGPVADNYIPWTNTFGNPGIPPNSIWPTPEYNSWGGVANKVILPKGSSFSYVKDGVTEYYVVINNNGIEFGRNEDAVTIDYAWGSGEMIKISTKPVVTWSAVVAENLSVSLGEVVYDDTASPGKYYISRQSAPINKWTQIGTGNWVEIK